MATIGQSPASPFGARTPTTSPPKPKAPSYKPVIGQSPASPFGARTPTTTPVSSGGGSRSSGGGSSSAQQQAQAQAQAQEIARQEAVRQQEIQRQQQLEAQRQAEASRIERLKQALKMRDMSLIQRENIQREISRRANLLRENLVERSRVLGDKIVSGYDVVSGGSVTERRILNRQQDLNKQIEQFNKDFSGELSESQYERALAKERELNLKQQRINQEFDALAQSTRSKVVGALFAKPFQQRVTLAEEKKFQESLISKTQSDINRMRNELATTTSRWKKLTYPGLIQASERELLRYQAGGKPIVFAGELPITPLKTIPKGITSVTFLGTQRKLQDGRVLVNIGYKTSAGRVGKAKGFVKAVGDKKSVGVTAGRSGVKYFRSPTKFKLRKVQSFVGGEVGLTKPEILKLVSKIKMGKKPPMIKKIFPSKNKIFYHGTKADRVGGILSKGLKPGNIRGGLSSSGEVFLTSNPVLAQKYTGGVGKIIQVRLTPQQYASATKYGSRNLLGIKSEIVGIGRTIPKQNLRLMQDIRDLGNLRNLKRLSNIEGITAIRKAKVINQLSAGRVATAKGTRAVKLGSKKLDYQNFISLSKSLTKKDLSVIAGRTITDAGAKSKFIGMIQNLDKAGTSAVRFSPRQAKQVSRAVQKLVNTMVGSIATAEKAGRTLSAGNKLTMASNFVRVIAQNPQTFTPNVLQSPKKVEQKLIEKVVPQIKPTAQVVSPAQRTRVRTIQSNLVKQDNKVKQLTKQLTQTKSKQKQKLIQRNINRLKQNQRQGLRTLQRLKQVQKTQMVRPSVSITPRPVPRKAIIPIPFKLPKGFESKKLPKQVPTYYVKVKRRGKIENLTPRPLTLNDARDFLAYKLDNTLMRTAWIEPIGKSRNVVRVPKNIRGYYGKVSKKLRPYRIRRGKKQQLRMGYIEKRRFALDTPGERKGKWTTGISSKRAVRRVQPKRKISGNQRRELLKTLERARAVRMRNLRRRR
jgi:hypothetical protein